jgi:hypothetical protein
MLIFFVKVDFERLTHKTESLVLLEAFLLFLIHIQEWM